jgi:hypothetical protein
VALAPSHAVLGGGGAGEPNGCHRCRLGCPRVQARCHAIHKTGSLRGERATGAQCGDNVPSFIAPAHKLGMGLQGRCIPIHVTLPAPESRHPNVRICALQQSTQGTRILTPWCVPTALAGIVDQCYEIEQRTQLEVLTFVRESDGKVTAICG